MSAPVVIRSVRSCVLTSHVSTSSELTNRLSLSTDRIHILSAKASITYSRVFQLELIGRSLFRPKRTPLYDSKDQMDGWCKQSCNHRLDAYIGYYEVYYYL